MNPKQKPANGKHLQSLKRQKFERKHQMQKKLAERERYYKDFVQHHSHFCHFVSESWHDEMNEKCAQSSPVQKLIEPYLNLKEHNNYELDDANKLFILEGTESVRVLIQQAAVAMNTRSKLIGDKRELHSIGKFLGVELISIFVKPSTFWEEPICLLKDVEQSTRDLFLKQDMSELPYQVLVGRESTLSSIAGFHIARGALACGKVPEYLNEQWLDKFLKILSSSQEQKSIRILALDGICDTANMGSMIRSSRAFDVDAVVLSSTCCDPWSRRSVRGELR